LRNAVVVVRVEPLRHLEGLMILIPSSEREILLEVTPLDGSNASRARAERECRSEQLIVEAEALWHGAARCGDPELNQPGSCHRAQFARGRLQFSLIEVTLPERLDRAL